MKGLYLAVLRIRATGFLTEHNLLEHLYVLHLELCHCIPPPLNLCHPPPQWLAPPLSTEKEDAGLTSAVLFRDPTPLSWLDVYKRADPEPCTDVRYLTHEEPVALLLSRLQCQLLPLSSKHVPPISPFPGSLPPPTAANLEGHLLVDNGRWGSRAGVSHGHEHSSLPMSWAEATILSLLNCRDFCCCQRWSCCPGIWLPVSAQRNTCWGLAGTAWAWKLGYRLYLSDASPHQHKSQGDLAEEVPMGWSGRRGPHGGWLYSAPPAMPTPTMLSSSSLRLLKQPFPSHTHFSPGLHTVKSTTKPASKASHHRVKSPASILFGLP